MSDIRVEIIYYQTQSDFEMEFNLAGVCHMRMLTCRTESPRDFIYALSRATARNRVIIAVGELNDSLGLCDMVARATSRQLNEPDASLYGISDDSNFKIPDGAMPLVTCNGSAVGCLMENSVQSMILLSDKRHARHAIMKDLIHQYIFDLARSPVSEQPAVNINANGDNCADKPSVDYEEPSAPRQTTDETISAGEPIDNGAQLGTATQERPCEPETPEIAGATEDILDEETEIEEKSSQPDTVPPLAPDDFTFSPDNTVLSPLIFDDKDEFASPRHFKRLWLIAGIILLSLLLMAAGVFSYFKFYMPLRAKAVYSSAMADYSKNSDYGKYADLLPDSALYKFSKLYNTNKGLAGWLSVGGADINYPVVTSVSKNDEFYQYHLYNNEYNLCGTPYIKENLTDSTYLRNTVIYTSGNWASNLCSKVWEYNNLDFYKSAPIITFDSLYAENTWKIFCVFVCGKDKPVDYEKTSFFDDSEFADYINALAAASDIVTSVDLSDDDEIITLVNTDAGGKSAVVVARKTRDGESVAVDVSNAVMKKDFFGKTGIISSAPASSAQDVSSSPIVEIIVSSAPPVSSHSVSSAVSSAKKKNTSSKTSSKAATSSYEQPAPPPQNEVKDNLEKIDTNTSSWLPLTATNASTNAQVSGSAVDIISQICAAEMGSSYEPEALKAQAIAAYCWMLCNGGASERYPVVPMKAANEKIVSAVTAVSGQAAYYNEKIAQLYYFAYSAGVTANCSDIWSSDFPYLRSIDSSVDKNNKDFQTLRTYKAKDIAQWILQSTGINLNDVSDKSQWFHLTYADGGNSPYVKTLTLGNSSTVYKGTYLRDTVFTPARVAAAGYINGYVLKSGAYTINYNPDTDMFTFTVKGYGHGVGMSQYGANQYALKGWTYMQILQHYYPGITIK